MTEQEASQRPAFTRLVLALSPEGASDQSLETAASLARHLGLEMLALCLEDEQCYLAVSHGFTAEIVFGESAPRPVDAAQLEADFRRLAARMERRLAALAERMGLTTAIERRRGRAESALRSSLRAGDIMVRFQPPTMLGRTPPVPSGEGAGAELAVPAEVSAREGVIAVIGDGAALTPARQIAAATGAGVEAWGEQERTVSEGPISDVSHDLRALDDPASAQRVFRDRVMLLLVGADAPRNERLSALIQRALSHRTPVLSVALHAPQPASP
ncbi:MAG: hypothetical protein AAFV62_10225 [Pseudomonadota bacterium]